MTSPANQQNTSAPTSTIATSYASAAGANKKPAAATPVIATGSQPAVVVSSSTGPSQHARSSSVSPMNGSKPKIMPAVPNVAAAPVAHGTSNLNGNSADHSRKSSVTMSAAAPNNFGANGGPVGGSKPQIPKFGFNESPAVAHSTPQQMNSAPMQIPGNHGNHPMRIPSPAHSPSPIPQHTTSGGRPPSTIPQEPSNMKFGSLGTGDGDRHMKHLHTASQSSNTNSPGPRRDSFHSQSGDMTTHVRGGFQQGGRGRGGGHFNNPNNFNQSPGLPYGQPYRPGPQGAGRGGMPPNFHPRGGMQNYSPQPQHASPAMQHAMPSVGGPRMGGPPAMPVQQNFGYQQPMGYNPQMNNMQQVRPPTQSNDLSLSRQNGKKKNKKNANAPLPFKRGDSDDAQFHSNSAFGQGFGQKRLPPMPPQAFLSLRQVSGQIDMSPASGNFERLVANKEQAYGPGAYANPQFDPRNAQGMPMYPPYGGMPQQYMAPPAQSPSPAFAGPYANGGYQAPSAQPMSRNASQASERPASSTSAQQGPVVVSSGPAPPKPKQDFIKPRRSAAIQIKRPDGEVVDTTNIKTPASPVPPMMQQSKTPPVVASTPTPTPPPKSATPSHLRNESLSSSKTAEQLRKEFQEQVRKTTEGPATSESADTSVANKPTKEAEDQADKPEVKAAEAEPKAVEASSKADEASKDSEKPAEVPKAAQLPYADALPGETEDEYFDRLDREELEREAKEAEKAKEHEARKAAAKKKEEEERNANAADNDRKLREQEREMERLEEEKERKARERDASGSGLSVADALKAKISDLSVVKDKPSSPDSVAAKLADLKIGDKASTPAEPAAKSGTVKERTKPSALNLAPLNTKNVEPAQPTAQQTALKTARFLGSIDASMYPADILSPNPAINTSGAAKKGHFRYDTKFLLQFKPVFIDKPSVDFDTQVKALMGDNDGSRSARTPGPGSGRQNSRTAGAFPAMGSMGSFGAAKTLPSGTTSEQRFAMSQGTMARPVSQIGSFGRPGGFPGPAMSRNPSSTNMGGMPSSPRQGSRNTRGGSRRHDFKDAKAEAQAAKAMPLTAGMELKPIAISATGWKASSVGNKAGAQNLATNPSQHQYMDPPMVQRKVKAALNKMTPEKFDKISDQILVIALQSKEEDDGRTLRQVIQLTFEKATDEAHWAPMYAKFCRRMLETMSSEIRDANVKDKNGNIVSGGALFRKYLLNRCQEEFERGWKIDLPKPKEGESKEAALLSDEYYEAAAAKRRGLGLVQFIGELFKLGMLTERIMHQCITKLVDYQSTPDEAEIESLSKLLRTVGASLDQITEKAGDSSRVMMNAYFERIQNMMALPDLPSRLHFMLLDVVDLRKNNWISKDTNKGPKTLEEIRADVEAQNAQKAAEAARSNQRGAGGRGGGMPGSGRGDARFPQYNQQTSNHVGMDDLRRLKGGASRTASSNLTLGPTSMFASRSNSGRRGLGPGGAFGRAGEESGASSRTGTPPTQSLNAFQVLAQMDSAENPTSPPSTAASPALTKAVPDSTKKA